MGSEAGFSLAEAGIAGVDHSPGEFGALTGCGRLSSQLSENNEHLHSRPPPQEGHLPSLEGL